MDTELATVFTDENKEYNNMQSQSPSIDLSDTQLTTALTQAFATSSSFLESARVPGGYDEIQFNLSNNFWGCSFNFGNNVTGSFPDCGRQIRQGIAHMIDKMSFTATEPTVTALATPVDSPVPPTSSGGLLAANPCGWDSAFPEQGSQCVVNATSVAAYHRGSASGAAGIPWLQAPGSLDLNAAAQHFVNAGVATSFNTATSVLTGINSTAASNKPTFYIRSDNQALGDLGVGVAEQICYLFTGSYAKFCNYLQEIEGPIATFPGFFTSTTSVSLNWSMYTGGSGVNNASYGFNDAKDPCGLCLNDPFDGSLYFRLNSRYVSGISSIQQPNGPCSSQSLPSHVASNYVYLCSPGYDSLSGQLETAPCLTAAGDPVSGASSNFPTGSNKGICSGFPGKLSAHSAGIQAEDFFGQNEFSIPVFSPINEFGYLNGWSRIINNQDGGIPNFFTWLNAYNPSPTQSGTLRQGMSQTTESVNPYLANTFWDMMIVGNVYDTLFAVNPLSDNDPFNWMTISTFQKDNSSLGYPIGLQAPAHTLTTYRFTLRDDLFFQDGRPVTAYDVAFSYLSMVGTGATLGSGAASMTGITILSPHQFDIGVNSLGVFVLPNLVGVPILPGRYWTCGTPSCPTGASSTWDDAAVACTTGAGCPDSQYFLSGPNVLCNAGCTHFTPDLMTVKPADTLATFDPIFQGIFVGSGPFECAVTSSGSHTCTSTGSQNPPIGGSYTLTRFGKGLSPASSLSSIYFRSSGNAALWIWSEQNDLNPSTIFGLVAACYLKPVDLTGSCAHFQQGIGGFNGLGGTPAPVNAAQVAIENRFYALNWVPPFNWATAPPIGIASLSGLVLYEGGTTLAPASLVSCPGGYDC